MTAIRRLVARALHHFVAPRYQQGAGYIPYTFHGPPAESIVQAIRKAQHGE